MKCDLQVQLLQHRLKMTLRRVYTHIVMAGLDPGHLDSRGQACE
jgi:hypothetical protein